MIKLNTKQHRALQMFGCRLVYASGLKDVDVDVDVEQMYERRPQPLCPTLCTLSITFMYTS